MPGGNAAHDWRLVRHSIYDCGKRLRTRCRACSAPRRDRHAPATGTPRVRVPSASVQSATTKYRRRPVERMRFMTATPDRQRVASWPCSRAAWLAPPVHCAGARSRSKSSRRDSLGSRGNWRSSRLRVCRDCPLRPPAKQPVCSRTVSRALSAMAEAAWRFATSALRVRASRRAVSRGWQSSVRWSSAKRVWAMALAVSTFSWRRAGHHRPGRSAGNRAAGRPLAMTPGARSGIPESHDASRWLAPACRVQATFSAMSSIAAASRMRMSPRIIMACAPRRAGGGGSERH
jgi:hypothetical protein